ncbi:response regulator transcription factor [Novosphingobium sp. KN65.2]|uniref:response regulator transcription factor n=1 Tax=Novosphingobium sp. KN65.2 TaxID=1478134 RepID=UPI0005E41B9B|nr:response regulator transcription factor [Novosphingobium sp. KN65.2]CDO38334.1 Two component transcriptional regulator, winged helix family (modular protein) [Novosphingobium sp. KN65.2]
MLKLNRLLLTSGGLDLINSISDLFYSIQVQIVDPDSLLNQNFDDSTWIFIDWLLPAMAGIQLVRLLRGSALGEKVRISMVLPTPDADIQMRALAAGADDYIVGPLNPDQLIDRMKSYRVVLVPPEDPVITFGDMTVDTNAYLIRFRGERLPLKVNEFRLLAHFVRHPDRIYTRSDLIGVLGRSREVNAERTVDVWMSRLRTTLRSLDVPYVPRTVRACGYILDTI